MVEKETADSAADAALDAEIDALIATAQAGLVGAADMTPKTEKGNTTLYGEYRVDNTNQFMKYEELSQITPHTFVPLVKLGLALVSGFKLEAENETSDALEKLQEWADKIGLVNKAQNIARCMVRDGTTVVYLPQEAPTQESTENTQAPPIGNSISSLDILPMRYITLLPDGVEPGAKSNTLFKGDVAQVVQNEAEMISTQKPAQVIYQREETAIFRIFHEGYFMKDIKGRETYGLYGMSMLVPVDRPIKNLMDLVEGFSGFMRRYGVGRLHLNITLAEELRRQGKKKEAKELLEDVIAAQRRISQNEDIVSYGTEVKPLATGTISGIDTMKQSLETDIHVGLLQSPLAMGKASGTTYASGYMSEEDRYIILESIQNIFIQTIQTEILDRQLELMGFGAGEIKIVVDPLDAPYVDYRTLIDMFLNDAITLEELREKAGFPKEKPRPERQVQKPASQGVA